MAKDKILGIIYTNVANDQLTPLIQERTLASIPFGGRYRLVDFALSNMVNSGITDVGIMAPENYQSLMVHLSNGVPWDLSRKNGGLSIFPPYSRNGSGTYRGALEAMYNNLVYLRESDADYVLVSDCYVVANMDYRKLLDFHKKSDTGFSVMAAKKESPVIGEESVKFAVGKDGELLDATPVTSEDKDYNQFLSILLFDKALLISILENAKAHGLYSLHKELLESDFGKKHARVYFYEGFNTQITSMVNYFLSNMMLLDKDVRADLFRKDRPVYTRVLDAVPAKYGLNSSVSGSMIADGCIIEGTVENSIIFRGVHIRKNAVVRNSIVMDGTDIGEGVALDYVIADRRCTVKAGRHLAGYETYPFYLPTKTII